MGTGKRLAVDYRAENTQPLKDWMEGAEIHWGEIKEKWETFCVGINDFISVLVWLRGPRSYPIFAFNGNSI